MHGHSIAESDRLARMNDLLNPRSLAALDPDPGDRVLDVGCGLGLLTSAIAELVGSEGLVVGVEYDSRQLERARKLLAEGGATFSDIVKATIFVVGQEYAQPGRDLCGQYFDKDNPPANTLVVCQALADPDFLVEVQAIAVG